MDSSSSIFCHVFITSFIQQDTLIPHQPQNASILTARAVYSRKWREWIFNFGLEKISQSYKLLPFSLRKGSVGLKSTRTHLDEAKWQAQDIAVKAIEGASATKALSQINQIAIKQAKNHMPN